MARFCVGRDEDDNDDVPSRNPPPTKKPRTCNAAGAAASTSRNTRTTQCSVKQEFAGNNVLRVEAVERRGILGGDEDEEEEQELPDEEPVDSEEEADFGPEGEEQWGLDEEEEEEEEQAEGEEEEEQQMEVDAGNQRTNRASGGEQSSTRSGDSVGRQSVGAGGEGPVSVTLSDPDVLDCPICFQHLTVPVFQCENGHISCASCCTKMGNKCGSCSWPIGYNRCRALEKVLESIKIPCRNVNYGCKETISYSNIREHEDVCIYTPCSCPHLSCKFFDTTKRLYMHFTFHHSLDSNRFSFGRPISVTLGKNEKHLFLQDWSEGNIFVLNHCTDRLGSLVNIVCIERTSARKFRYNLIARDDEGSIKSSIKLTSFAENMEKWTAHAPTRKFLLIPSDFIDSGEQIKLDITILKRDESPTLCSS